MKKPIIVVYAIAMNEEKFVNRWYESIKEADDIYVLDTGSTDNTVSLLKKLGVNVISKIIKPFRFDLARNESLKLIRNDADICICLDLDEVIEPGWKQNLINNYEKGITRYKYVYNWSIDDDNKPIVSFYQEKIHSLKNFKWINPVHEILNYNGIEKQKTINELVINHYPDYKKSRSSYLPLLELAVKEDPENDRNMHYLGREYMYYGKYNEAIDTLIKHLSLKSATWNMERCASMRFIGRCYKNLNRIDEALLWYQKAIEECPTLRDPYVEKAILLYNLGKNGDAKKLLLKAKKISINERYYINEVFSFDETIDDLLSLIYFYESKYDLSLRYVKKALKIKPNNERLQKNYDLINKKMVSI